MILTYFLQSKTLLWANSPPVGCPLDTLEVVAPCRTPCKKAPLPSDPLPTELAAGDTAGDGAGAGASPEEAGLNKEKIFQFTITWILHE